MNQTWGWIMTAIMVLFLIALIAFAIWMIRLGSPSRSGRMRSLTPQETLDHRLASGQISPAEYREQILLLESRNKG